MYLLVPIALVALAGCPSAGPRAPERQPETEVVHAPPPHDAPDEARYRALVLAANGKLQAGELRAGLDLADEALRLRPFDVAAGVAKVEAHLGLGERTQAVDFAARLHQLHAARPEPAYAHGKALYALGRFNEARDAFADGLAAAPADGPSQLGYLTVLAHDTTIALGELEERAAELTGAALEADALHALAVAHELRADPEGAEKLYLRAIAARPRHPFAHYNLARLYQSRAAMTQARPHFQAFLDQAPPAAAREAEAVKSLLEETRHD